ncbi:gamma-aminobutyric acid receptor subunit delta-like [Liolophura sinensis]|uniref:gamma-aminobutyric acid receptor subunit delta-like n=1 Tax=Liolophura sinensis TaxID=3198878 RepID=UPI0031587A37
MTLEELMEHLFHPDRYNKKIRPGANDGKSSEVAIGMYVHSLSAVSELNMEYTIDMYFRQFWNDPRLAFNHSYEYITLDSFFRFSIWLPDPYFMNSKDEHFHTVTVPNIMIRIDGNGDVFYSQRFSVTLSCDIDLLAAGSM